MKNLWFLLAKKTSSSANDRNTEALIESYGSLAPKRYKYSEVLNITSSLDSVSLEKVVMEQFTKEGYTMISTLP